MNQIDNYHNKTTINCNTDDTFSVIESKEYKIQSEDKSWFLVNVHRTSKHIILKMQKLKSTTNPSFHLHQKSYYYTKFDASTLVSKLNFPSSLFGDLSQIMELLNNAFLNKKVKFNQNNQQNEAYLIIQIPIAFKELEYKLNLNYIVIDKEDKYRRIIRELNEIKEKVFSNNDREDITKKLNDYQYYIENNIKSMANTIIESDKRIEEIEKKFNKKIRRKEKEIEKLKIDIEKIKKILNVQENTLNKSIFEVKKMNSKSKNDISYSSENDFSISSLNSNEIKIPFNNKQIINKKEDQEINDENDSKIEFEKKFYSFKNKEVQNFKQVKNNDGSNYGEYNGMQIDINNNKKDNISPTNLRFLQVITNNNEHLGANDIFEVFNCIKDNKKYLVSINKNYSLDIYDLKDNKLTLSLKGHNNKITTVRYFINSYNLSEYLISADYDKKVIIWDVSNNFNKLYTIETQYNNFITSCLMMFNINTNIKNKKLKDLIIVSTRSVTDVLDNSSSKIYSLEDSSFIDYIYNTNKNETCYILPWENKVNQENYVIELCKQKVTINNLLKKELFGEFIIPSESYFCSGFIRSKQNRDNNKKIIKDFLWASSTKGFIMILDIYQKSVVNTIDTNKCYLYHIIQWNDEFGLVADYTNNSFKIIDLNNQNIICNIGGVHSKGVVCVKKIDHPIYGKCLLSCGYDSNVNLWGFSNK